MRSDIPDMLLVHTDEFSPQKSINTQARSVVLIKLIWETYGELPALSTEEFIRMHKEHIREI